MVTVASCLERESSSPEWHKQTLSIPTADKFASQTIASLNFIAQGSAEVAVRQYERLRRKKTALAGEQLNLLTDYARVDFCL
jgi:hypothetical protein